MVETRRRISATRTTDRLTIHYTHKIYPGLGGFPRSPAQRHPRRQSLGRDLGAHRARQWRHGNFEPARRRSYIVSQRPPQRLRSHLPDALRSYYGEPDTPGTGVRPFACPARFPADDDLDGTSDENLVVDTPAFAASPSTNPSRLSQRSPGLPPIRSLIADHASAELVENAEGRLIGQVLKLNRRDAGRLAGDQISRPKPCAQRHMAAFHDGANRQALGGTRQRRTPDEWRCGRDRLRMAIHEAVAPSSFFLGSTLRFIGKKLLKLARKGKSSR